jgi:cyanophycin synthetase
VRRACRSKSQARTAFAQNNLPYAQGSTFISNVALLLMGKYAPLEKPPTLGLITKGKACVLANFKALIGLIKVLPNVYP